MSKLQTLEKVANTTSYDSKALVSIDFGNGQPKAILDIPGVSEPICCTFPSIVQELPIPNSDCIRLVQDGQQRFFKVGHLDQNFEAYRTGNSATGKIDNARALLVEVIKRTVNLQQNDLFHCDVLYTTPNNREYFERVNAQLEGVHNVQVPTDPGDFDGQPLNFTIRVNSAYGELESVRAIHLLEPAPASDVQLFDLGDRTAIYTRATSKAAVKDRAHRRVFDGKGVYSLAVLAMQRQIFAGHLTTPNPQEVIAFMFDKANRAVVTPLVSEMVTEQIKPVFEMVIDRALPVYLVGGGAALPGVSEALGAKAINKNPQWASIEGLAKVAKPFLAYRKSLEKVAR
jgi:hypothetical protein